MLVEIAFVCLFLVVLFFAIVFTLARRNFDKGSLLPADDVWKMIKVTLEKRNDTPGFSIRSMDSGEIFELSKLETEYFITVSGEEEGEATEVFQPILDQYGIKDKGQYYQRDPDMLIKMLEIYFNLLSEKNIRLRMKIIMPVTRKWLLQDGEFIKPDEKFPGRSISPRRNWLAPFLK